MKTQDSPPRNRVAHAEFTAIRSMIVRDGLAATLEVIYDVTHVYHLATTDEKPLVRDLRDLLQSNGRLR